MLNKYLQHEELQKWRWRLNSKDFSFLWNRWWAPDFLYHPLVLPMSLDLQLEDVEELLDAVNKMWHLTLKKKRGVRKSLPFPFNHSWPGSNSLCCLWWTSHGQLLLKPVKRMSFKDSDHQQNGKHVFQETRQVGCDDFIISMKEELNVWLATVEKHRLREELISIK